MRMPSLWRSWKEVRQRIRESSLRDVVDFVEFDVEPDKWIARLLADLKHCMASMNQMFNALLDLSRLEAGALAQRAAPVALHTLVRDTATLFREQAIQRGLALRMHLPQGEAMVWPGDD